jgi:hypothetical protein
MLKFEYLIIHSYINEKNKWVVNYLDNESIELLMNNFNWI